MSHCIAGIGSRKTPSFICTLMIAIGAWCRENDIYVRSGHAAGADYSFEVGAREHTIIYLPFPRFNSALHKGTKHVICWDDVELEIRQRALRSVEKYHPAPHYLKGVGRKLMARNYFQIHGTKLESQPVNAVVCWTPSGKGGGGTGQAIRMADSLDIPVLDLGGMGDMFWTVERVTDWIESKLPPPAD